MFNPVPPGPEQPVPRYEEHEHEPAPRLGKWRPPGRWPALLRLSWLCRLLAILSLAVGALLALLGLVGTGERAAQPELLVRLLYAIVVLVSAVFAFIFWTGMAELILLAIALERNTRQARDRQPRHAPEEHLRGHEITRGNGL
jgi:hypothetical protein